MIKKILLKPNVLPILVLLTCSIIVCIPLLSSEIDISYDDGIQHMARLIGTEASIKEGQTAIMSDFCNGFGYSWNLFYSPITAFVPLLFRIFNFSYVNCIKIFMFIITLISGITMYFFTKDVTKNKKVALIAGIIYIFAPYRFTDMYIRNALAELTTFAIIPIVFQGLYGVLKQKEKREILLIIGVSLLLLTHTIITMYIAIICVIYVLTQIKKLKVKEIRNKLIYSAILITIITCFFWLPLLQIKNSAEYEVFKEGRMERQEVLVAFKLDLTDLLFTKESNSMIYEIGLFNILVLLTIPFIIKKIKKQYKGTDFYRFYIFSIICTIALLIMTLKLFPFENMPSILKMIQFTFRLLEFTSFFIAFIVAVNIDRLLVKFKNKKIYKCLIIVIVVILTVLSIFFKSHFRYTNNLNEEWLIPAVAITEKTGRVHAGCASFEYLPSKAFENRNYIETRLNEVIVLNGEAEITNYIKDKSKLSFDLKAISEEVELELPYIYYPGYEVKVGNQTIDTYETEKGFVGIKVANTDGKINVKYTGTVLMKFTRIISLIGISVFIIDTIRNKKKK